LRETRREISAENRWIQLYLAFFSGIYLTENGKLIPNFPLHVSRETFVTNKVQLAHDFLMLKMTIAKLLSKRAGKLRGKQNEKKIE